MVMIPRTEREVKTSGSPLPYSTGDGYEAVGKAAQGLGQSLVSLGIGAEKQRDDLDMFQTKLALQQFQGEQDQKQTDADLNIAGDGRDHTANRMSQYDGDAASVYEGLPNNRKAREYAALHIQSIPTTATRLTT
jgi:hypothetical protein